MKSGFGTGLSVLALLLLTGTSFAAEPWNQWRGPNRNGWLPESPELISALPEDGLKPLWVSEPIASGRDGGWGSPAVVDGRVYLFTHTRRKRGEGDLPPKKFPWLPPEKRNMTAEQYAE